jgi:hypothetical protein
MTDVFQAEDRDVCALQAAAAIDAVLDQRCPEMKTAFWRAVERYYRQDTKLDERPFAAQGVDLDDHRPVGLR